MIVKDHPEVAWLKRNVDETKLSRACIAFGLILGDRLSNQKLRTLTPYGLSVLSNDIISISVKDAAEICELFARFEKEFLDTFPIANVQPRVTARTSNAKGSNHDQKTPKIIQRQNS